MTGRRFAAAIAVAALALSACGGDDDASGDDAGTAYAEEVAAIMSETVTPAGIAATDAITNVAQDETDVEGVLEELDSVAADLHGAEGSLGELEPPEAAAATAEELGARIGVLADRLEDMEAAELESDPQVAADNVRTDLDRIERRARQIAASG